MTDARGRIEKAAVEEFGAHGFHGARVHRITHRAGVNKQLLYYYFGSKRQLYEHALRVAAEGISTAAGPWPEPAATEAPGERLRQLLRLAAEHLRSHPTLVRATLLGALDPPTPGRHYLPDAAQELAHRVAAEVSRGQGLGYFRDDADPDDCGRHAAVLLLGWIALARTLAAEPVAPEAAWLESVVALLDRSLTW